MSTDVKTMNRKVFKAGMKKSHRIIHTHVQDILSSACERLLADAVQSKEFQGFTGNTHTPVGYTWTVSWPIAVSRNHGTDLP